MNINEFDKNASGIEGTGIDTVTKADRTWKNKSGQVTFTIPAGSKVHVDFSPKLTPSKLYVTFNGEVKISRLEHAHDWLKKFNKAPSANTLEKWEWDSGTCKTPTGCKVETDGFGPDGSPSWMLVMGLI